MIDVALLKGIFNLFEPSEMKMTKSIEMKIIFEVSLASLAENTPVLSIRNCLSDPFLRLTNAIHSERPALRHGGVLGVDGLLVLPLHVLEQLLQDADDLPGRRRVALRPGNQCIRQNSRTF